MRSTGINRVMFVATLAFLYDRVRGDAEVTCVVMESCVLPCTFHGGNNILIHWIDMTTGNIVHSYYYDKDQFKKQDQRFRNRTSLFKEQISRGNASLRLTRVEIGDQGKYKCHSSTPEKEATSFVNLKVEDAEVTCVVMESCVLPCKFHAGNDILIHWIDTTTLNIVHSYYYDKDQFQKQDQRFRNRTSLFKEQISRGNASLRLTRVETGDQGKYICHSSTPEKEATSFVNLKVEAPVTSTSVLLNSTQLNLTDHRSGDENQDGSENEHNNLIIGVVSGVLVAVGVGGLIGYCLYRHKICCSSKKLQSLPAEELVEKREPNGETDPLNNQEQ